MNYMLVACRKAASTGTSGSDKRNEVSSYEPLRVYNRVTFIAALRGLARASGAPVTPWCVDILVRYQDLAGRIARRIACKS